MTDLDLTEAIDAAAKTLVWETTNGCYTEPSGQDIQIAQRVVEAAAPLIAAQVRRQTVREVARHLDREGYALPAGVVLNTFNGPPAPTEPAAPQLTGAHPFGQCICVRCGPPWRQPGQPRRPLESWMALCPRCGDKRCPGAADHDNPCRKEQP